MLTLHSEEQVMPAGSPRESRAVTTATPVGNPAMRPRKASAETTPDGGPGTAIDGDSPTADPLCSCAIR